MKEKLRALVKDWREAFNQNRKFQDDLGGEYNECADELENILDEDDKKGV